MQKQIALLPVTGINSPDKSRAHIAGDHLVTRLALELRARAVQHG
jgi:hypothetical protein